MTDTVARLFADSFQATPSVFAKAPGRVEVLGNHTDYNEGFVLSCAIDNAITVAVAPADENGPCEFVSTLYHQVIAANEVARKDDYDWANYPLGVYAILKSGGYPVKPFRLAVDGNVPAGAGLSSSAALEVATGLALSALYGLEIAKVDLAKICQRAENEFVGANCGLLDQFSSLLGEKNRLLFTDFRSLDYTTVPLPGDTICLAITTSGVTHQLVASEYNSRREECSRAARFFQKLDPHVKALRDVSMVQLLEQQENIDPVVFRRARHVVGENERVRSGIEFLEKGDIAEFGHTMYKSHESSRINFQNSCDELNVLVAIARETQGVYGSRLSGGGFGGATLTLLDESAKDVFEQTIVKRYKEETGRETSVHFAKIASGAEIVTA